MTRKRIPERLQAWMDARKRDRLSHAHVETARELGMSSQPSRSSPGIRRCIALISASVVSGCGGADGARSAAGTREAHAVVRLEWPASPVQVVVGELENLPGHTLHRVVGAVRTPDGRVIVADRASNELRFYEEEGSLVRVFGGTGGGPEEFGAVERLWLAGRDTIVAWDFGRKRLLYLDTSGNLLHARSIRVLHANTQAIGAFADGKLLLVQPAGPSVFPPGHLWLDSATVWAEVSNDSIVMLAKVPWVFMFAGEDPLRPGRAAITALPFAPRGVLAVGGQHFYFGTGEEWDIQRFDGNGQLANHIRKPGTPRPLPDQLRDSVFGERISRTPVLQRPGVRRFFESLPLRKAIPAFDQLLVDEGDHVWARHYPVSGTDSTLWSVFTSHGDWQGDVVLPPRFLPSQITQSHILGVLRAENGIEQIGILRLRRGE
jgi:hypothetical protein